ncbi:MAG: arsenosugar biosynthesis radical SAM protein ArsS [Saprospiraceae bacterium]|nr:arsenosugar biosynthesis radical SAM protein ArsS [Saprospiraceae bacterium]
MKSLNALGHRLTQPQLQLEILEQSIQSLGLLSFENQLKQDQLLPLKPTVIDTLQINLGKLCNQTCAHCHVDAGPDRKEVMPRSILEKCLEVLSTHDIDVVDITGGAPELNPHFRWFVEQCYALGKKILVRCNLTIIVSNKKYHDLPDFYKSCGVQVISSLPFYNAARTDSQRGEGVFEKSITALQMLNQVGYGADDTALELNLVFNPTGTFLPGSQSALEQQFKRQLKNNFGINFNHLFTITNLPISRYLDYLLLSGNLEKYLEKLILAYNPKAAQNAMCRNIISVDWEGSLYDCDFNQMLDLKINERSHISEFDLSALSQRNIIVNNHCYACAAGAGSSCGGATV